MKTIDLTGYKKSYLSINLPEIGMIHVETPSKELYSEMMSLSPEFSKFQNGNMTKDDAVSMFNAMYSLASSILSRNREREEVTVEYLDNHFDADTILGIFNNYLDFVAEVAASRSKN